MAILSGLGGVSNPLLPSEINQQQPVTSQTTGETTAEAPPPPYQFNTPRLTLGALGIDLPRNFGDSSAIFAEISLLLERTIDEARKNRTQAETALLRSAYSTLIEVTQTLAALDENVRVLKADRSEKQDLLEGKLEVKEALESNLDYLQAQSEATSLQLQQLRLLLAHDPSNPFLQGLIASAENELISINNSIDLTQQQLLAVDEEIAALGGQIEDLSTTIKDGEDLYKQITDTSLAVALTLVAELQGSKLSQSLEDTASDFQIGETTERVLRDLVELDERNQDLAAIRQRLEDQGIDRMTADRIVAATLSLVTALKDVLETLQSLDGAASPDSTAFLDKSAGSRVRVAV